MTDTIQINRLEVFGRHGVFAEETHLGQRFIFDVLCHTDFSKCAETNDVEDAVNYASVCDLIVETSSQTNFRLIEALADRIAKRILGEFSAVSCVTVSVSKPSAPVPHIFDSISVRVTRSRDA